MNTVANAAAGRDTGEVPGTTPASPPPNPFVGPVPLDLGQTLHGRRRETEELSDLLVSKRVVVLFSPSGAGKTSLIRAGLVPKLTKAYEMEALPIVRLGHRDPECGRDAPVNRYRLAMLLALEKLREEGARRPTRELRAYALKQYFEECVSGAIGCDSEGKPRYPLLILDQFEELFTTDPLDVEQKREFLEELGNLLSDGIPGRWPDTARVPIWALFAIREDRLAELQPYLDLFPTALAFRFRLDALGVDAAREAIGGTAGSDWMEPDVPQRLVDDLRRVSVRGADGKEKVQPGRFVEPVQLQVVCRGLWEKIVARQGRRIEAGDVQSRGQSEVDRALRDFFDQGVFAAASDAGVSERKLREWIERHLISASGVRTQTLRDVSLRMDDAITRLVDAHLLRCDTRDGHDWIELPHDRLVAPIRDANNAWTLEHLQPFQKQAEYWRQAASEHKRSLLLSQDELAKARDYERSHAEDVTEKEKEYLEASQQEIDRKAKEHRERLRRSMMVGAAVLIGVLTTWFFVDRRNDAWQRKLRDGIASLYRKASVAREQRSNGAALDMLLPLRAPADVDRSGRLLRVVDNEILQQLTRAPAALVRELQPRKHVVWSLAFTGDGNRLLAGSWDGHLSVQDVAPDGAEAFETEDLKTVTYAIAMDGAKGLVASTHGDGSARLWRLNDRRLQLIEVLVPSTDYEHRLTTADFSDDGRWLAVAGWHKGELYVWDVSDRDAPAHVAHFLASDTHIVSIAFLPRKDVAEQLRLATTDHDGVVRLWPIGQGMAMNPKKACQKTKKACPKEFSIQDHEGRPVGISASAADPSGRYFVAGDTDGFVHLWDLDSDDRAKNGILLGRSTYGGVPQDMAVKGVAFAPQSSEFVTVGIDGYVVRWTLPSDPSDLEYLKKHTMVKRFRIGDGERLYSVAYRPNKPAQIAVGGTRSILLLALDRGSGSVLSAPLPGSTGQTTWQAVSMDAKGTRIAARSRKGPIRVWLREHDGIRAVPEWDLTEADSSAFALSPDGQRLVTVDCHGWPTEWSLRVGTKPEPVHALTTEVQDDCPSQPPAVPSFSPGGRFLATANDNTLRLWQRGTSGAGAWSEISLSTPLQSDLDNSSAPIHDRISTLAFSMDAQYLAVGAGSGEVHLWKMQENPGSGPFAPVAHVDVGQRVSVLTFKSDGTTLLVGGDDGILTKCSVPGLTIDEEPVFRHVRSITGATYAWPKGRVERSVHVTADAGGYVVEWITWPDMSVTIELTDRESAPVRAIALNRDGTLLVTAGQDLLAWNLAPDQILATAKDYAKRSYGQPKAQPVMAAKQ